jgi:hypothetical protein
MRTSIEIFDDPVKAQARLIELQQAGASNPRLLQAERLSAVDRRSNPPAPEDWIRRKIADAELQIVQYER